MDAAAQTPLQVAANMLVRSVGESLEAQEVVRCVLERITAFLQRDIDG